MTLLFDEGQVNVPKEIPDEEHYGSRHTMRQEISPDVLANELRILQERRAQEEVDRPKEIARLMEQISYTGEPKKPARVRVTEEVPSPKVDDLLKGTEVSTEMPVPQEIISDEVSVVRATRAADTEAHRVATRAAERLAAQQAEVMKGKMIVKTESSLKTDDDYGDITVESQKIVDDPNYKKPEEKDDLSDWG